MTRAIVLAGGPSLDTSCIDFGDAPVVAVNSAIEQAPRADYWVGYDPPSCPVGSFFDDFLALDPLPVHRMNPSYAPPWELEYRTLLQLGVERRPYRQDLLTADWLRDTPWLKKLVQSVLAYSIFQGLATAIERCGGTAIELYGADMKGPGYASPKMDAVTEQQNRESTAESRWIKERESMVRFIEGCARNGVTIDRRVREG